MSAASDYLENELLDHVFRNAAYTSPSSVHVSLHTGSPGEADDGANELTGNGYARQTATFAAASGGEVATSADITFTASGGDWSAATYVGIYDAASSGNLLAYKVLSSTVTVLDGGTFTFSSGDLTVSLA